MRLRRKKTIFTLLLTGLLSFLMLLHYSNHLHADVQEEPGIIQYASSPTVYFALNRNGTSSTCQLYIHYDGPYSLSYFKFAKVSIYSSNQITNELYGSFGTAGTNVTYHVNNAGTHASKYLTDIIIPANVNSARVVLSSSVKVGYINGEEYGAPLYTTYIGIN